MAKKELPFSGAEETAKQTDWSNTDWRNIKNYSEWKDADLQQIDLQKFNWRLANQPDVSEAAVSGLLERIAFDTTKRIKSQGCRFRFNGHEVMHPHSIMNITGQKKNGKSQWLNILVSITLKRSPGHSFGDDLTCGKIECINPADKILWIDTEQSNYDIQDNNMRLFNLMGLNVTEFDETLPNAADYGLQILPLRPYSPEQRALIAEAAIKLYQPDIVIIDGIRDLMYDINDQGESTNVANWVLKVADERDIWCVIHQNPGDNSRMRGAIGTELGNKCELTFQVEKAERMFSVTVPPDGCRQDAGDRNVMFRYESRTELKPVVCENVLRVSFQASNEPDGTLERGKLIERIKVVTRGTATDAVDFINLGVLKGMLKDVSEGHKGNKIYYEFYDPINDPRSYDDD